MEEGREIVRDRISALPDEIIHHILARLRSPSEAGKATVLSKRWTDIWRSYPILEYSDDGKLKSARSEESFTAAATAKFSDKKQSSSSHRSNNLAAVDAVRMRFDQNPPISSGFIDNLLLLAAAKSLPREINLQYNCIDYPYIIPAQALSPPPSHSVISRLRVLKLRNCEFDQDIVNVVTGEKQGTNPFAGLRELYLSKMGFGDRFLNNIIAAAASNLQSLTLHGVWGIRRLRIRNLPNLKLLRVQFFDPICLDDVEITGANNLETLDLRGDLFGGDFKVSNSLPNLKVLRITYPRGPTTEQKLDKLISAAPCLESLTLVHPRGVRKLKIVNKDKLREFKLEIWGKDKNIVAMGIDAPRREQECKFHYDGPVNFCPRIVMAAGDDDAAAARSLAPAPSFYWELSGFNGGINNFKRCLERLSSQFLLTLRFRHLPIASLPRWNAVENELSVPRIEHVIFAEYSAYINDFFEVCHPKYLSFACQKNLSLVLEYIHKHFKRRDSIDCCTTACNSWCHRLEDMKIVKRATNNNGNIEDENIKVEDVPTDMFSSDTETSQFCFC